MNFKKSTLALLLAGSLIGCNSSGGGSSSGGEAWEAENNPPATAEAVRDAIKVSQWYRFDGQVAVDPSSSNYTEGWAFGTEYNNPYGDCQIMCTYDSNTWLQEGKTYRFDTSDGKKIPVFFNFNSSNTLPKVKDSRFTQAIDLINNVVGYELFEDMGYIEIDFDPSATYSSLDPFDYTSVADKSDHGFILSVGSSSKLGDQCGKGSTTLVPNTLTPAGFIIDENNHIQGGWTWVNIDSNDGTCIADTDIAAHEIMHALGFISHFKGFGDGAIFGDMAKSALRTLYNNDAGTDPDNLTYYHWGN